jgi:hypothetical protein
MGGSVASLGGRRQSQLAGVYPLLGGSLSVAGSERAVVGQEIATWSRPAYRLRFIHPAVHQEIGRSFGDRRPYPQIWQGLLRVTDHLQAFDDRRTRGK